jgi:imidazolonepropionase
MLGEQSPPVADLVAAGAALAISTDFNPGTSPVLSMPEAIAIGCSLYGIAPTQALISTTANPAWVLELHHLLGSLEPGKRADFLVLDDPEFRQVPYRPGHNPVTETSASAPPARRFAPLQ